MLVNRVVLEVKNAAEKLFKLELEPNTSLGEIYDALHMMKNYIFNRIKEAEEQEAKKADESPKEEVDDKK